jgi:hypothetical protein
LNRGAGGRLAGGRRQAIARERLRKRLNKNPPQIWRRVGYFRQGARTLAAAYFCHVRF